MKSSILKSLSYFDIFNHPLKKDELANLCGIASSEARFTESLSELLSTHLCYTSNGYYSIQKELEPLIVERQRKERLAQDYFDRLPFYSSIIKSFPFVKGVAVSGSLSKGVMYEKGDIDYFIITTENRLWICRTLLILFKKVVLLNSRKYFCVNYFVDEKNLEILDKNVFTAVEVAHLIPVYNSSVINQLKQENSWTQQYFPAFSPQIKSTVHEGKNRFKSIIESIFVGKLGDRLDLFFMNITYKRWMKKFNHFSPEKLELTMRSNRGISKHHPSDFQNRVLKAYQERLIKLKLSNEGSIHA